MSARRQLAAYVAANTLRYRLCCTLERLDSFAGPRLGGHAAGTAAHAPELLGDSATTVHTCRIRHDDLDWDAKLHHLRTADAIMEGMVCAALRLGCLVVIAKTAAHWCLDLSTLQRPP